MPPANVQKLIDIKCEELKLTINDHNRIVKQSFEKQEYSGIKGPDAAKGYIVGAYIDSFKNRVRAVHQACLEVIEASEASDDLDDIAKYVDEKIRKFRDDVHNKIRSISDQAWSREEPNVLAVYENLKREFDFQAGIVIAKARKQFGRSGVSLGSKRIKTGADPVRPPTSLAILEKVATAKGDYSATVTSDEFVLFKELEASNYLVGQIGPDSHDAPETMVSGVRLTANGRILMERTRTDQSSVSSTKEKWIMEVFISHSSHDTVLAEAVAKLLRASFTLPNESIRCTSVAGFKLPLGANTDDRLKKEVSASKVFIALLTPSSIKSPYVLFEMGARWGKELFLGPLLARGATMAELGPISGINALHATEETDLHQFLSDVAAQLNRRLNQPAAYLTELKAVLAAASVPT